METPLIQDSKPNRKPDRVDRSKRRRNPPRSSTHPVDLGVRSAHAQQSNQRTTITRDSPSRLQSADTGQAEAQQSNRGTTHSTSNSQQQSNIVGHEHLNGKPRRRQRGRGWGRRASRGSGQQAHSNTSKNNSLIATSDQPEKANGRKYSGRPRSSSSNHSTAQVKKATECVAKEGSRPDMLVGFSSKQSEQTISEDFRNLNPNNQKASKEDKGNNDDGLLASLKEELLEEHEAQNSSQISSHIFPPTETGRNTCDFGSTLPLLAEESLLHSVGGSFSQSSSTGRGQGNVIGGTYGGHCDDRSDYHQALLATDASEQSAGRFGIWTREILPKALGGKAFLKWLFLVLNVVVEVCQAALTQEAAQGKMGHKIYLKLSFIISFVCLIMSLVEAFHEGRRSRVKWRRRRGCCWFYHPGPQGRLFGSFLLWFGIICSTVQLLFNTIAQLMKVDFIKFDFVPLLLSICHLTANIIASRGKTNLWAIVDCKTHGYNAAKPMIVDGFRSQVYVCPQCQMEKSL